MALPTLPLPPSGLPFTDPATGKVNTAWQNYLLALEGISLEAAPVDAQYWLSTSNPDLTNERNIGLLATGFVFITTAVGIATPSSVATIPLLRGGTAADLSATGGASQVLQQLSAGAAITVGQLGFADISGLAAGTYSPTLTNVTNVAASTSFQAQYLRVGATVTVSGRVDVDPTLAAATELGISLPIASNIGALEDVGGVAFSPTIAAQGAAILGDIANNRASMQWVAVDITNQPWYFTFTYQII